MTIKADCPMKLEAYPMDTQYCPLTILSCKYYVHFCCFNYTCTYNSLIKYYMLNLLLIKTCIYFSYWCVNCCVKFLQLALDFVADLFRLLYWFAKQLWTVAFDKLMEIDAFIASLMAF